MANTRSQEAIPTALTGIIAPMYTPVHRDGAIDDVGVRAMVEWLADRRCVRSVFARSGMGKMFTFTVDETMRFASMVQEANAGRMGLLLGSGGEWLGQREGGRAEFDTYVGQAIHLTRFAGNIGADAAVHVLPAAIDPAAGESHADLVYRYYRAIDEETDTPVVLYQPGGMPEPYRLTPALMGRLLELPGIVGLKLSTDDDSVFDPIADVVRDHPFAFICGHEGYYARGLRKGAVGVIGQGCNGYPEILAAAEARERAGDPSGADRAMDDVWRGLDATNGLDSSVALKQYIASQGYAVQPYDRSGSEPCDDATVQRLRTALNRLRGPYCEELGLPCPV